MEHEDHDRQEEQPSSDDEATAEGPEEAETEEWLTIGLRDRPFRKKCPDSPEEYCDLNRDWAQRVYLWCLEAQDDVDECCGSKLTPPVKDLPTRSCNTWQGGWTELGCFANSIRPFLSDVEEQLEKCTGVKIKSRLPTPKREPLPGPDTNHAKEACKRARDYSKQLAKEWGPEISETFNDYCEDNHPTHLGPPPDPPF